jgi:hypothetical protein
MNKYLRVSLLFLLILSTGLVHASGKGITMASVPIAPGDLNTLFLGPWLLSLSWTDNSADETSFVIEQSASSSFAPIQSEYRVPPNTTRFVVKDLIPDRTYYFRIRSENGSGPSEPSAALAIRTQKSGVFPLSVTDGLLHTSGGEPFLIIGDSPWSLIVGPDMAGAEKYLDNRKDKGVNSLLMNLVETFYNGPTDAYGNQPFLTPGDFTTPNPAYFDHADYVIGKALEKGMEVFLCPAYLGYDDGSSHAEGWYSAVNDNGPDNMYQYGKYLGERYKDYKNIIWVMGGDCAPGSAMDEIRAMVKGIEETAGPQVFSVHNGRFYSGITTYPDEKWIDLNTTYTDKNTVASYLLEDYNRRVPFFYIEGTYESDNISGENLRSQMYLPVLMGANGFFYGNASLFEFNTGWDDSRVIESQGAGDLKRFARFFASRAWYGFHPDLNHTLLTDGAGDTGEGNYAPAAIAEDSSSAVIYIPDNREVSVDLDRISGSQTHYWWYDPSNGDTIEGSVVSDLQNLALNPPSEGDWLLVLENAGKRNGDRRSVNITPEFPRNGNSDAENYPDTASYDYTGFVYPNPATDEFHISVNLSVDAQITIFDIQGKTMPVRQAVNNTIDISSFPEGLYFVKLFDYDMVRVTKLVKRKSANAE